MADIKKVYDDLIIISLYKPIYCQKPEKTSKIQFEICQEEMGLMA